MGVRGAPGGRTHGVARTWRLLVIGSLAGWLAGEVFWYLGRDATSATALPVGVTAYFLPPVLSLAAMVLLAVSGGGVTGEPDGPLRPSRLITALDGMVAATSFSILVIIAGFGDRTGSALPRSNNTVVLIAYSMIELIVVVVAMLIAIAYRPDRPYRANYLLLAIGA